MAFGGSGACVNAQDEQVASSATDLGIRPNWMDRAVKPGDDFYAYADGGWMKSAVIPADRDSTGSFLMATQATDRELAELVKGIVSSHPAPGSAEARIKNFYLGYLDTAAIEHAGLRPVQADLDRFAAIGDKRDLARAIGEQLRADVDPINATNFQTENLFGIFVTQALAADEVVPYILQGGLGMPDRAYYLSSDPEKAKIRAAYRRYIEDILAAASIPDAKARAEGIFQLETEIAKTHATREESEDLTKAT